MYRHPWYESREQHDLPAMATSEGFSNFKKQAKGMGATVTGPLAGVSLPHCYVNFTVPQPTHPVTPCFVATGAFW